MRLDEVEVAVSDVDSVTDELEVEVVDDIGVLLTQTVVHIEVDEDERQMTILHDELVVNEYLLFVTQLEVSMQLDEQYMNVTDIQSTASHLVEPLRLIKYFYFFNAFCYEGNTHRLRNRKSYCNDLTYNGIREEGRGFGYY